ncbi:MAG: response regulator [Rickettsiales bacterium]|jgi:two-component system phosphate regulon response regulator OmpR|nr:response regulator [Rickettsiales bacterium]
MISDRHLLLVDDDDRIRVLLSKYLGKNGFFVSSASCVTEARILMEKYIFDLIVVDYMMPEEDGLAFISKITKSKNKIPMVMLTAMNDVSNRIEVLSSGADDYVPKPFEPKELILRINNILRRIGVETGENNRFCFGDFVFHYEEGELYRDGELIKLTDTEIRILRIFCDNFNRILSREKLCSALDGEINERSIDVQITRLRKKIENNVKSPIFLKTVRNGGYVFTIKKV